MSNINKTKITIGKSKTNLTLSGKLEAGDRGPPNYCQVSVIKKLVISTKHIIYIIIRKY